MKIRIRAFLSAGLLIFWASQAWATATNLGTNVSYGSSGTESFTSGTSVSAGTLVVIIVDDGYIPATNGVVTDSVSNTYTLGKRVSGSGQTDCEIWYSFIATPLTTSSTITYTTAAGFSGSNNIAIGGTSFTGYSSIDAATTAGAGPTFSTTYSVTGAGSAAVANELNYAVACSALSATAAGGSWLNTPPNAPAGGYIVPAYQVNSGTSALTYTGTAGSNYWAAAIVSFKPASAVSGHPRLLLGVGT